MNIDKIDVGDLAERPDGPPETLDLRDVAQKDRFTVDERISLQDAGTRKHIAYGIMVTFVCVNLFTLVFLWHLTSMDNENISQKIASYTRVVDHSVIMTMLGAATVQLGSLAVIMAKYLFPGPDRQRTTTKKSVPPSTWPSNLIIISRPHSSLFE